MWGFSRKSEAAQNHLSISAFIKAENHIQEAKNEPAEPVEHRSVMSDWDNWFEKAFTLGWATAAGIDITPETASKIAAVYACNKVLSEAIASLPLITYRRRPDGGKEVATDHPLYPILHRRPNNWQTAFEFFEMLVGHSNFRGNYIAYIQRTKGGQIYQLVPMDPTRWEVELLETDDRGYDVVYYYHPKANPAKKIKFTRDELLHFKLYSEDGLWGNSPIQANRETLGLASAAGDFAARFFANDATPGVILEHPGRITVDAAVRLKTSWDEAHTGSANSHKTVVLEEGMKANKLGMSPEDSQLLETRNFQVEEIARIFRVPSILIGHPDTTMTYASAEQLFLSFVVHTVRPWLVRIEQVLNTTLFPDDEYFCEFKLDGLLRGDVASRYQAYSLAIQNRIMNPNEVRALENLNPYDGGESYENPNITTGQPGKDEPEPKEPDNGKK